MYLMQLDERKICLLLIQLQFLRIFEMMPWSAEEVRSILASKRIPMDGGEVDNIVDTVRKQIL